jgi:hypothetical protein
MMASTLPQEMEQDSFEVEGRRLQCSAMARRELKDVNVFARQSRYGDLILLPLPLGYI